MTPDDPAWWRLRWQVAFAGRFIEVHPCVMRKLGLADGQPIGSDTAMEIIDLNNRLIAMQMERLELKSVDRSDQLAMEAYVARKLGRVH